MDGRTGEARPWREERAPTEILAIRLQAFGDVAVTLPYLHALKRQLPESSIDLLTRREDTELPRSATFLRHVDGVSGGRSERLQLLALAPLLPRLAARRYDVVIDLQNNRVSRTVRRTLRPRAWTTFDCRSPISAGQRTQNAIEALGFSLGDIRFEVPLVNPTAGQDILVSAGWDPSRPLVVLSPSGAFPTRNWPIDRYVEFADLWRRRHGAQFAIMGLPKIADKAERLSAMIGADALNLVGRTSPSELIAIVQRAALVLTEDCGLMHVAWTSGVPTVALFGSSRHDWSAPIGNHSTCLHSGDLPCGACMDATCQFGDVRCLTRYAAPDVVEQAERLLARLQQAT